MWLPFTSRIDFFEFNLIPEETVFIDDKKENIEAAKKLGFLTIHLTDPEIIIHEINRFI